MMQSTWFKLAVWILATSFFFMASAIFISAFGPPASESQTMQYMHGMIGAMHNSLMGYSMAIEQDTALVGIIYHSASIAGPLILIGIASGLCVRFFRRKNNAG